jgi:hypothetical protein
MTHRIPTALVILGLALVVACGGKQDPIGGEDLIAAALPSMMSEVEEQGRNFLYDLSSVVEVHLDDPDQLVARVEAFLRVNQSAMLDNAAAIEARYLSFDGIERRVYEAQYSAFMQDAWVEWRDVRRRLTSTQPRAWAQVRDLIERVDGRTHGG